MTGDVKMKKLIGLFGFIIMLILFQEGVSAETIKGVVTSADLRYFTLTLADPHTGEKEMIYLSSRTAIKGATSFRAVRVGQIVTAEVKMHPAFGTWDAVTINVANR